MARKRQVTGTSFDDGFDAGDFLDEDLDVERFVDAMERRTRTKKRRKTSLARRYLEERQDQRWLHSKISDWDTDDDWLDE